MRISQKKLKKLKPDFSWQVYRFGWQVTCQCYTIGNDRILNVIKKKEGLMEASAFKVTLSQYEHYKREMSLSNDELLERAQNLFMKRQEAEDHRLYRLFGLAALKYIERIK